MFRGLEFFPFVRAYGFAYSGELEFTLEHLRAIIPEHLFSGTVQSATFAEIQQVVNSTVSWDVDVHGVMSKTMNQELIKARTFIFFDVAQAEFYFDEKITHYFIYHPAPGDYFSDSTRWRFCFIFFSKSYGIIFCGKSWENSAACKPETESEDVWRKNHGRL